MRLLIFLLLGCCPATALSAAAQKTILVVGDSLSAAYGMPEREGWVSLLQQRLVARKLAYRVINASVSGETTAGGRARIEQALRKYDPAIVLLALGANDGLRGLPLATIRSNLDGIAQRIGAHGARLVVIGMRLPPNLGPSYGRGFERLYRDVAAAQGSALVPFLLAGFAHDPTLFQSDGLHPSARAQALMLENVWPALAPLVMPVKNPRRAAAPSSRALRDE